MLSWAVPQRRASWPAFRKLEAMWLRQDTWRGEAGGRKGGGVRSGSPTPAETSVLIFNM